MSTIFEGFRQAFLLIAGLDRELLSIIFLSLQVSGTALLFTVFLGLPLSALLAFKTFPMKRLFMSFMNTLMGLPPVVVGLFVYLMLSRSGPLGFMGLLYTVSAMITAQAILGFPIVVSLCHAAIISVNPFIRQAALTLGATGFQSAIAVIKEARYGIMAGIIAAFGRLMAEVGAILIVGGNIAGYTRVMTTTIALETDKGTFELALALGIVLLFISVTINIGLHSLQSKEMPDKKR
jgi:tungstate transport system permease protein